jgi:HEAT repeat protein
METLLLSYDESPYVSAAYQATLEGAADRAAMLASRDLPPELPEWIESLQQDNVRALSALLISDLLRLEEHAGRAAELTRDMAALVDDLLLSGDFPNAHGILQELQRAAAGSVAAAAARAALTSVADSVALLESAAILGDLDDDAAAAFAACCDLIGPAAIRALYPALTAEPTAAGWARGRAIVAAFGADAAPHLSGLLDDPRPSVHRNAAMLLGATRCAAAVPPLQALLRKGDPQVLEPTIAALAAIDDPAAARALQTALRASGGEQRTAIVGAIVAARDVRTVPMLVRLLEEIDPFGPDHDILLEILDMMRQLGDARAVAAVVRVMRRRRWFGRRKGAAFKAAAVRALAAIGTPDAKSALEEAKRSGDRLLKRAVRTVEGR